MLNGIWVARAVALAACVVLSAPALAQNKDGVTFEALSGVNTGPSTRVTLTSFSTDLVVDVTGIQSWDGIGAAGNTRLVLDATPGALVDQIAWNVNLTATGASFLSEITVTFTNDAGQGVRLRPGVAQANAGTAQFTGSGSLAASMLAFNIGTDGKLYLEFHESFDDLVGAADGAWNSGTLTFAGIAGVVPEPGTYAMMALGLLAVGALARRRQR